MAHIKIELNITDHGNGRIEIEGHGAVDGEHGLIVSALASFLMRNKDMADVIGTAMQIVRISNVIGDAVEETINEIKSESIKINDDDIN
jgi:hypothetical protein